MSNLILIGSDRGSATSKLVLKLKLKFSLGDPRVPVLGDPRVPVIKLVLISHNSIGKL